MRQGREQGLGVLSGIVIPAAVADHEGQRHFVLAAGQVVCLRGKVEDGVETDANEIHERNLNHRPHARHRGTGGDADEPGLGNRGINDTCGTEFVGHADRRSEVLAAA